MESLLPITLVLNFLFLGGFGVMFYLWMQRGAERASLQQSLEEAGGVAASSRRQLENFQQERKAERERLAAAEAELRMELETARQGIADKDVELDALRGDLESMKQALSEAEQAVEPLRSRARESEDKVLNLDRDCARFRSDVSQAMKRMESAESAARDAQVKYERLELAHEEKDAALLKKQQECAAQDRELAERRTEIAALIAERDRLLGVETALGAKLNQTEERLSDSEGNCKQANNALAERELDLKDLQRQLASLKKLADEQAAAGGADAEQRRKLQDQVAELEGKLARKEAALSDLEQAFADAEREKPYEAHRHMEWTLNHFDPKAITFKFTNEGAKAFLVGVETNIPELRYELETGHELPRDDFEARIKLAIKKAEQKRMEQLPDEFDMTVLYALHVFPINFKIRPREGQKIERVM